jgi:DNA polymerase (family 10)
MDNYTIADNFSLLAKLMDIHGENSFKSKSYSSAAFAIEKLPIELTTLSEEKIFAIKGVGEAIGKKIIEQISTGQLSLLNEYLSKTPSGILDMLSIKGIGPKKIAVIWKDLEIESLGELLYACNENRLLLYKGFGEKTQQNIKEAIEYFLNNVGSYLYQQVEQFAENAQGILQQQFPASKFALAGEFIRHMETIDQLLWITTVDQEMLTTYLAKDEAYTTEKIAANQTQAKGKENLLLVFKHVQPERFYQALFENSCSDIFLDTWKQIFPFAGEYESEAAIFENAGVPFIPAYLRETAAIVSSAVKNNLPVVIQDADIAGIIHSHSKWSDGSNSIEEMIVAAKQQGLQYLVISDHSKSAFYANGLYEERIIAQHQEIDALNAKYAPFKVFKSIESDILNDGSLDYHNSVLSSFDLVIASVHSNLKMREDKAMMRLLAAIENPYTSILGHMTGRLLLSRNGYPVDHKKIIDACAANAVVIELNAHPKRLDIDWRWIDYCTEKGVMISIDPDAHTIEGYKDIHYGVLAAQKAGITKAQNLSSFSLAQMEIFIAQQKSKRP